MEKENIRQFRERLIPLYKSMIEATKEVTQNYDTIKFCMQWGEKFPVNSNEGLLFVGRANNGWETSSDDVNVLFKEDTTNPETAFNREDQMSWMQEQFENKGYACKSPFLWSIRHIAEEYYDDNWWEHIAWSNLCKIAPAAGNNPNESLYDAQLEQASLILKEEIRFLSPRFVIMFTREDWANPFIDAIAENETLEVLEKMEWSGYENKVYLIDGVYYIVTEHPARKPYLSQVEAICNIIDKYK